VVTVFEISGIRIVMPTKHIKLLVIGKHEITKEPGFKIVDVFGMEHHFLGPRAHEIAEDIMLDIEMCHVDILRN